NVILQSLLHVEPFRDHFLLESHSSPLFQRLSLVTRKMWHDGLFKAKLLPLELWQCISDKSNRKFDVNRPCDLLQFLAWILNEFPLFKGPFTGQMEVSRKDIQKSFSEKDVVKTIPFLYLTVDLPPMPLFQS